MGIAHMMKVGPAIIDALRDETPLADPQLEALRSFMRNVPRDRGLLDDATVSAFLEAGYTRKNMLEVVLGYSQKIMSNSVNHMTQTPVGSVSEKFAWTRSK
jgi:alkylhydroperoxidase family enzyme